jgi:hypothetical protein
MADSQYSLASAAINSMGSPAMGGGSATLGLAGFIAPLAQLNQALNTVSLDIRLLTAGQNKLGEALTSLTAVVSSARSAFKRLGVGPAADSPSPSNLDGMAATETPDQLGAPNLNVDGAGLRSTLRSSGEAGVVAVTAPERTAAIAATPQNPVVRKDASDKAATATSTVESNGSTGQTVKDEGRNSTPGRDVLDASLSRLGRAVTPDMSGPLTSLSAQVDKLSSVAEQHPVIATGLAAVAVTLSSIASVVGAAVATEALTNVAKKILKRTAPRLPWGLGDLIGEDNRGADQDNKPPPPKKRTESSLGYTGDQARKKRRNAKPDKAKGQGNPKGQSQFDVTVQPRVDRPAVAPILAQAQTLAPAPAPAPAPAQRLVQFAGSSPASPLLGKAAKVGSFLPKRAPGLNLLSAGVDIAQGVATGDTKAVASSAGMVAGSYAGAALGTMIFPGVGTAIGGFLGGIAGSWLGEKLATPSDQLGAPDQVSKDLTSASTQTQTQQINYSPSIQVTCTGADNSEHIRTIVAQQLQTQFHGEFVPLITTNALATRRGAALTDGGL